MIKHANRKCLNLAYLKREDQPGAHDITSPLSNHRYTLLSIAKINTNGFDTYNNYFLSPYRREYLQLTYKPKKFELKESHVSRLLITFVKIYAIKYLIQPELRTTARIDNFYINFFTDIFEEKFAKTKEQDYEEQRQKEKRKEEQRQRQKRKEEVRLLWEYFKPSITKFFQEKDKEKEATYEEQVQQAKILIKKQVTSLLEYIGKHQQEIRKSQILPENVTSLAELRKYIYQNYKKIDSIDSLKPLNRKYIYDSFLNINRPFLRIKVPYFIDTFNIKENAIILPKYSDQLEPVLSKLVDYVPRIHKTDYGRQQRSLIVHEQMKQLVSFFRRYKRKTSRVYPITNLKDIYYDQKSMKTVVSYHPLIYDVIGIKDSSKSTELRLATEPTPSFNFQICHLQLDEDISWKLRKKYYYPKQGKPSNQQEQSSQKQGQDILEYEQNIHVWRIINKLYFMSSNANMVNDLYEMYYCRIYGEQKTHIPKPFKLDKYREITERIYENISANPEMLTHLIPQLNISNTKIKKHTQANPKTKQQQLSLIETFVCHNASENPVSSFHFTLSELSNHFQPDDDSLFENLKLTSFNSELYYRLALIKQINLAFDSKVIFKRMLNVKKYLIMFFVSIMEKAYLMASVSRLEQRKFNARDEIENQLEKEFKNVCFNSEFERRKNGLQMSISKIKDYMGRKDYNFEFLNKNQHYYDDIFIVHHHMKMADFQDNVCRLLERNNSKDLEADIAELMKQHEIEMNQQERQPFNTLFSAIRRKVNQNSDFEQLKTILSTRISNRIKEMHEKASFSLKKLTQRDVQPYVESAQVFHKAVDLPSKAVQQVCLFYNFKLLTMLKMYLTSNNNNWRRYQRMYSHSLIGGKTITLRSPLQQIKQLDGQELQVLVSKMKMIIRSIGEHK